MHHVNRSLQREKDRVTGTWRCNRISTFLLLALLVAITTSMFYVLSKKSDDISDDLHRLLHPDHDHHARMRKAVVESLDRYREAWVSFDVQELRKAFALDARYCTPSGCTSGRNEVVDRIQEDVAFGNDTDARIVYRSVALDPESQGGGASILWKAKRKLPAPAPAPVPYSQDRSAVFACDGRGAFVRLSVFYDPSQTEAFYE